MKALMVGNGRVSLTSVLVSGGVRLTVMIGVSVQPGISISRSAGSGISAPRHVRLFSQRSSFGPSARERTRV